MNYEDVQKLKWELKKCEPEILNRIVYELMLEKYISYVDISKMYVSFLEVQDQARRIQGMKLAYAVSDFWDWTPHKRHQKSGNEQFIRSRAAYHMLPFFRTSPFEKELENQLKEYPYTEDENWLHTFNNK